MERACIVVRLHKHSEVVHFDFSRLISVLEKWSHLWTSWATKWRKGGRQKTFPGSILTLDGPENQERDENLSKEPVMHLNWSTLYARCANIRILWRTCTNRTRKNGHKILQFRQLAVFPGTYVYGAAEPFFLE